MCTGRPSWALVADGWSPGGSPMTGSGPAAPYAAGTCPLPCTTAQGHPGALWLCPQEPGGLLVRLGLCPKVHREPWRVLGKEGSIK